jgi:hypothetical protein
MTLFVLKQILDKKRPEGEKLQKSTSLEFGAPKTPNRLGF